MNNENKFTCECKVNITIESVVRNIDLKHVILSLNKLTRQSHDCCLMKYKIIGKIFLFVYLH